MNPITIWLLVTLSTLAMILLIVVIAKRMGFGKASVAKVDSGVPESDEVFGEWTPALGAQLPITKNMETDLRRELRWAGYYRPTALREYNALRFVLLFSPLVVAGILAILAPPAATRSVLVGGLIAGALFFSIPRLLLAAQARRRVQMILRGLPDAVDLINMGVSRGLTFGAALDRVQGQIHDIHPELSGELAILQQQARIGTLEQALRQLERRIDTPEMRTLAGTLAQTERLGTSLSAALGTYAGSVRATLKQNAERAASTAPFKLLFPIVMCMVPAVYMILLGPAVLEISRFIRNRSQVLGASRATATRIGSAPITQQQPRP